MELILASSNLHKAEELTDLLSVGEIKVLAAKNKIEVIEDGTTFMENALKKAVTYYQSSNHPTISDDSGLIVEALPGQLGIHTARFGGEGLSDKERCQKLLEALEDKTSNDMRAAFFICQLCLYVDPKQIFFFEGKVHGYIAKQIEGSDGFGYDPLFIPNDVEGESTLAQLSKWKSNNSHRAKACAELLKFFKESNCQNHLK